MHFPCIHFKMSLKSHVISLTKLNYNLDYIISNENQTLTFNMTIFLVKV